jgi:hypothetical protein
LVRLQPLRFAFENEALFNGIGIPLIAAGKKENRSG